MKIRIGNFVFMDKNGEYEINPTKEQMAVVIKQAWDENKQLKKELEKLKEDWGWKRTELIDANRSVSLLTQTKDSLEKDVEILKKSLELACDPIKKVCLSCARSCNKKKHIVDYFIQQAKKELGVKSNES